MYERLLFRPFFFYVPRSSFLSDCVPLFRMAFEDPILLKSNNLKEKKFGEILSFLPSKFSFDLLSLLKASPILLFTA